MYTEPESKQESDHEFLPGDPSNDDEWEDCKEEIELGATPNRNRYEYRLTIATGRRYGLSLQQIASIVNSVLVDQKIKEKHRYLSQTKVKNMMKRYGAEIRKKHDKNHGYKVFGFDGKRGPIKMKNCKHIIEEQITVIDQVSKDHVDHYIPQNGKGISVAQGLYNVIDHYNSTSTLMALSADGTVVK